MTMLVLSTIAARAWLISADLSALGFGTAGHAFLFCPKFIVRSNLRLSLYCADKNNCRGVSRGSVGFS